MTRVLALAAIVAFASLSTACVQPCAYDWGRALAHPTMTTDDVAAAHDARVHAQSEGTTGNLRATSSELREWMR